MPGRGRGGRPHLGDARPTPGSGSDTEDASSRDAHEQAGSALHWAAGRPLSLSLGPLLGPLLCSAEPLTVYKTVSATTLLACTVGQAQAPAWNPVGCSPLLPPHTGGGRPLRPPAPPQGPDMVATSGVAGSLQWPWGTTCGTGGPYGER